MHSSRFQKHVHFRGAPGSSIPRLHFGGKCAVIEIDDTLEGDGSCHERARRPRVSGAVSLFLHFLHRKVVPCTRAEAVRGKGHGRGTDRRDDERAEPCGDGVHAASRLAGRPRAAKAHGAAVRASADGGGLLPVWRHAHVPGHAGGGDAVRHFLERLHAERRIHRA